VYYHDGMEKKKEIKHFDFKLDPTSALPVYEQVKDAIKMDIMSGYLEEGDQLMPIRELAKILMVNPNTIVKVYYQLDVEGYLYSQPGVGYFVKVDHKQQQDERLAIFQKVTDDYVSKVLKLGYSIDSILSELMMRTKGRKDKKEEKKI
jgi:GntR family transcriptional regulator